MFVTLRDKLANQRPCAANEISSRAASLADAAVSAELE
jgi:hypothetical protein